MTLQQPDYETDGCLDFNGRRVPIFDASAGGYIRGITNICFDMVCDCGIMAKDQAHRITTLMVYPTVYYALRMNGSLWEHEDNITTLQGRLILKADASLPKEHAVHDSYLCAEDGEVLIVLRTREY